MPDQSGTALPLRLCELCNDPLSPSDNRAHFQCLEMHVATRQSEHMTAEQEWAEDTIERATGTRVCRKPMKWRNEGPCASYGDVLRLNGRVR